MERAVAVLVVSVQIRAGFEKREHVPRCMAGTRRVKGRLAILVAGIDVRAGIQQRFDVRHGTAACRQMEGCLANLVPCIHVCASIDEGRDVLGNVFPLLRRRMEGRPALGISIFEVRAMAKKNSDLRGPAMDRRQMQRG